MKKYMIEILPKFNENPSREGFQDICTQLVDAVDESYNQGEKSFHVTYPLQNDIEEGRFKYRIHTIIKSESDIRSAPLFAALNEIYPLTLVTVQETRFCKKDTPIFWFHEGETTYWDGGTYISPNYDLYVNGNNYYTIQYVPVAIKNMQDRDKKRYNGITYMWRCTGSWDNFMEAKTIDEAIEEFEKYYQKQLWKAVEGCRKHLDEATDNFAQFEKYRWKKKW